MRATLVLFVLAFLAGCNTTCVNGNTGVCDDNTCDAGGCAWEATGAGEKTYDCAGGGCDLTVSGAAAVQLDCAGGDCTISGEGSGTVTVSCAGGGCAMTCSGQGTCEMTDCDDGSCTNECTVVTATCTGP